VRLIKAAICQRSPLFATEPGANFYGQIFFNLKEKIAPVFPLFYEAF
jgi:hypothetical protein